jgi:quercetin dioxygenase-like cupin family protein
MQASIQASGLQTMVITAQDAQIYSLPGGGEARLMLTGENTNGSSFMGRFREDPGFMTQLHYHPHTDEQFYILEGVLSVYTDEKWHELGPGTLGVLPKGKPHAQGNRSDKPVHFIGSGTPAGFEKFFPAMDALMKTIKPGTPEFIAEFKRLSPGFDLVSLGPAPV